MKLEIVEIHKSLHKAYLKQDLYVLQVETLKTELKRLFKRSEAAETNKEHEEHFKNIVADFLKETYYKNNFEININKRKDLVIHCGRSSNDAVGVIVEAKRPSNTAEMICRQTPNVKAMHELVHYYLDERIVVGNTNIKYMIATNTYEWFIFDAVDFERTFYDNKKLKKQYEDWHSKTLPGTGTDFLYDEIIKPFLDKEVDELPVVQVRMDNYKQCIADDNANEFLIPLYKILSPEHLLKQPFANDSNSLNKEFYNELLHIIGLEEVKDGGKKLITRKSEANREDGSLLENAITCLKTQNRIQAVENLEQFGATADEQLFSVALELCITWINRVLFLKLLEGQLIKYHNGNSALAFINAEKIADFGELNELFFEILAVQYQERSQAEREKFGNIPYLNSSLFEANYLEQKTVQIVHLKPRLNLSLFAHSVLKNRDEYRNITKKNTLHYLFEFLGAYNFSSDSSAKIQQDNKTMINASVLGLIFEKINGYKDGSFFTPGFITMYMCRETIRRAVVQKFKERENDTIETFDDVKCYCAKNCKKADDIRFNSYIDDLKICDPAVGSGHFLVSALNEIIAIKSELNILSDSEGMPLEYEVSVDDDELTIINKKTNLLYEYLLGDDFKPPLNLQKVQVALFEEKKKIIERCLFGVDINPKSVMICRLRLWIELLKNAYYFIATMDMETLPNIDINIKCGNSLISRFKLDANLKQIARSADSRFSISAYQIAVQAYKTSTDKTAKWNLEKLIREIKKNYVTVIEQRNPVLQKYYKLKQEYDYRFPENGLFAHEPEADYGNKNIEAEKQKLAAELKKVSDEIEAEKTFYQRNNAFEWRFEFPEVLNEDGDFMGFDVVVGNPPYIPLEDINKVERNFYKQKYNLFERKFETSVMFIIQGFEFLTKNGLLSYIAPATWQTGENYQKFRKHIIFNKGVDTIINLPFNTFEDAYVDTSIYFMSNNSVEHYKIFNFDKKDKSSYLKDLKFSSIAISSICEPDFKIILDKNVGELIKKFNNELFVSLGETTISTQGLSGSNFIETNKSPKDKTVFPFLAKGNVYNYALIIEHVFNTDLSDKKSLIPFYDEIPKLLIRRIINRQDRLSVGYCEERMIFKKDINPFICIDTSFSIKFLLGVLASKFISYVYLKMSSIATKDDFRQTTLGELRKLPIPKIDYERQEPIIDLVNQILKLKKQNPSTDTSALEAEIDRMVYALYGLTEEEIKCLNRDL